MTSTTLKPASASRTIVVEILAKGRWFKGTLRGPERGWLLRYANNRDAYIPLTQVAYDGRDERVPFINLRKQDIQVIVGPEGEMALNPSEWVEGATDDARILVELTAMFETGDVTGSFQMSRSVRLSDFLGKQRGFLALRECTLRFGEARSAGLVLVNTDATLGFIEEGLHEIRTRPGSASVKNTPADVAALRAEIEGILGTLTALEGDDHGRSPDEVNEELAALRAELNRLRDAVAWTCGEKPGETG